MVLFNERRGELELHDPVVRTVDAEVRRFGAGDFPITQEFLVPFQKFFFGFGQAFGLERATHPARVAVIKIIATVFVPAFHWVSLLSKEYFYPSIFLVFCKASAGASKKRKPRLFAGFFAYCRQERSEFGRCSVRKFATVVHGVAVRGFMHQVEVVMQAKELFFCIFNIRGVSNGSSQTTSQTQKAV